MLMNPFEQNRGQAKGIPALLKGGGFASHSLRQPKWLAFGFLGFLLLKHLKLLPNYSLGYIPLLFLGAFWQPQAFAATNSNSEEMSLIRRVSVSSTRNASNAQICGKQWISLKLYPEVTCTSTRHPNTHHG